MVFDLLRLDGRDLTAEPLTDRRALLEGLGLSGTWQVPASYDDGAMLFDATFQQGLEGIVSKRRTSRYTFDQRTPHWLKFAHRHSKSYVVGGWRPQEGTSDRLAAVLVGEVTPDGLLYRGRVGSGIGGKASAVLTRLLAPLTRTRQPLRRRGAPHRRRRHLLGRPGGGDRRRQPPDGAQPAAPAAVVPRRARRPGARGPRMRRLLVAAVLASGLALAPSPARRRGPGDPGRGARRPPAGDPPGGDRRPHPRLPGPGGALDPDRRGVGAPRPHARRPDRVRRPRATGGAASGERHHAAGHLPAAVGVRHPRPRPDLGPGLPAGPAR